MAKVKPIIILIFGVVIGFFLKSLITSSSIIFSDTEKSKQVTFDSGRVPLTFKHPSDFPVMAITDDFLYQRDNWLEYINLGSLDIGPSNPPEGEAVVIVEKLPMTQFAQKTPEEIILQEYKDQIESMKKIQKNFKSDLPELEKIKLGNVDAFKVINNSQLRGTFDNSTEKIIVVRPHGVIYTIIIEPRNPQRAVQLKAVLQTFEFKY